jgi:hypothetical protein
MAGSLRLDWSGRRQLHPNLFQHRRQRDGEREQARSRYGSCSCRRCIELWHATTAQFFEAIGPVLPLSPQSSSRPSSASRTRLLGCWRISMPFECVAMRRTKSVSLSGLRRCHPDRSPCMHPRISRERRRLHQHPRCGRARMSAARLGIQ